MAFLSSTQGKLSNPYPHFCLDPDSTFYGPVHSLWSGPFQHISSNSSSRALGTSNTFSQIPSSKKDLRPLFLGPLCPSVSIHTRRSGFSSSTREATRFWLSDSLIFPISFCSVYFALFIMLIS